MSETLPPEPLDPSDIASLLPKADAVRLEAVLPMDWVETITPQSALADVMADNGTLLRALLMLDDSRVPADAEQGRNDAIQHLERRIDLLLIMASTALRGMNVMPPERSCVLSARHLLWGSDEIVGVGRRVWARIYLRHRIALPLMLPGQIVEEVAEGDVLWHRMAIESLDDALQGDLERFIFRHHRRQVARQRAAG
ncbi:MAG: PilZ domain-containing protein [Betaproteobacteria bacterium]|jgi:Atypical PilZ domain, cyclic di-GMP receptor|nr:PilZ domain-containing protein [Betaproteobacteria bacterium]